MLLMRRLFIRLWGIFIVRSECPGERLYVIRGAPIPMSFSEKGYRSSVVMVEYEEDKNEIHQIDVPPYVRLLSIPDRPAVLEEVLEAIHELPDGEINARSP